MERWAWIVPHSRYVFKSPHSPPELINRLKSVVSMNMTPMQRIRAPRGGFEGTLLPDGFHIIRQGEWRRNPPIVYGHFHRSELGSRLDLLMLFNPVAAGILAMSSLILAIFLSNFLEWGALIPAGLLWLPFLISFNREVTKTYEFLEKLFDATLVDS